MNDLAKLNRLRVNAGKPELKAWRSDDAALLIAIKKLEEKGFTDVVPGANLNAEPITDDPTVKKARPEEKKEQPKIIQCPPALAKGVERSSSRQSRIALALHNERERANKPKAKKPVKTEPVEASFPKDNSEPTKAERQQKHIEEKKANRATSLNPRANKEKPAGTITVADLCRELKIDPKQGRAKLRRHSAALEKLPTVEGEKWTFKASARDKLVSLLQGNK